MKIGQASLHSFLHVILDLFGDDNLLLNYECAMNAKEKKLYLPLFSFFRFLLFFIFASFEQRDYCRCWVFFRRNLNLKNHGNK